jgi:16S rRNA (uracil1498-N3)-methyltransferase
MHLFIGNIIGNVAEISGEEAQHFSRVLRGKIGQEIYITDGKGHLAKGVVSQIHSKTIEIDILDMQTDFEKRPYYLHIAIAPTKNMDRMEYFLEKATEIGIDEISFLKSFHSERKNINLERCQKIVSAAVKQSLKAYVPKLNDLVKFNEFVQSQHSETKFIAHCESDLERKEFKKILQPQSDYLILIGPEGDFSREEIQLAESQGFTGISLGHQRFRTETAALNAVFGVDWAN